MKKYIWWILKFMVITGCIIFSTTLGLIPTIIILGISSIKPIVVGVSIALGYISIPWNNLRMDRLHFIGH
ncbi:hypothetical protein [Spiroplasma endosymbiont of Panzeria rudis]|uniref:hypothetical protein n=1 Tax=Spiroplasma endosymbiont of Panzeria rudis TaxID=3066301 RepID=UPI0030CF629B